MNESVKTYHPAEEALNVITHLGALLLVFYGGWLLAGRVRNCRETAAAVIYLLSLAAVYASSGFYHLCPVGRARRFMRLCDHASIYLLIAGTYTPLMLIAVGGASGITVLIANWTFALIGITMELTRWHPFKGCSLVLYVIMGWLCIVVAVPMIEKLTGPELGFLLAGGVAYTSGIIFYLSGRRYAHALWHMFVIAGSVLQFISILMVLS